jgi:predicted AlkP superfamily phosphohydrolase/phosphomutase
MSLLLPRTVQRCLETDKFQRETDWTKTKAFSLPSLQASFVRVNLRGREPHGIINPGRDYEGLLSQIETDLRLLVDVRSGEPAVERVIRTAEAFRCGPPTSLPDLVVEWKSTSYLMDRVNHPKAELVQDKQYYNRSSHHTMYGSIFAAGPSIREGGDVSEVSPLDFAPLFLSLIGEPMSQRSTSRLMNAFVMHPSLKPNTKASAAEVP